MAFFSTLGNTVGKAMRSSWLTNLLDNTKWNVDRINGDDAQGTGAGGHDHTGGGEGSPLVAMNADITSTVSEAVSTTTSGAYVQKMSHSFTPIEAGTYMIMWQAEVGHSVASGQMQARAEFDNTAELGYCFASPDATAQYCVLSGFEARVVSAAAHTLDIDFLRVSASGTANIRRARVTTWRVL